jgi:hypothetical protein
MNHTIGAISVVVGIALGVAAGVNETAKTATPLRLMISEVQPGTMASVQYCTLVFADHRFHTEKSNRKMGRDRDRKVYEGELSDSNWKALEAILDNNEFHDLVVPQGVSPLVIENAHPITISVARNTKFQNMEFLDNKSRKPYDRQLKPLLEWWKTFRGAKINESIASPDSRCSLDSTHGLFSN